MISGGWSSWGSLACLVFLSLSCQGKPEPVRESSTAAPSVNSEAPKPALSTATPPPKSYPADLSFPDLTKQLGCSSGKAKNACSVWKEFQAAGRFTGDTPSGEGRWFGRAHVVEKGEERTEYILLISRHVPTAQVGPSSLPLKISIAPIPTDFWTEAKRMWTTISRGRHRVGKRNLAARYIDGFEPKDGRGAINTTGMSVQLIGEISEDIAYLRQPELKKLLLVRPSRQADAPPGDGTYAEFWQTAW